MLISICPRRIGIDDRFQNGRGVGVRAVQPERLAVFFERAAGVQRAAADEQTPIKAPQPIEPVSIGRAWRGDSRQGVPGERLAKEFGIGNVEAAIDDHFVSQTAASVYPGDAYAAAGAVIEHRGFDSAQLRRIQNRRMSA